jgi:hypothetical protein
MSAALPRLAPAAAAVGLLVAAAPSALLGPSALAAAPATAARTSPSATLYSVAAVSRSDAWAVGSVIEHWNGRRWSVVPGAKTGRCAALFYGVAARSASSAWAVGYCGKASSHRPVIERWNGHRWSLQPNPRIAASSVSELDGVSATSSSNAWAVGAHRSKGRTVPLVEHWNGRAWKVQGSPVAGPHGAQLTGVTALSATSAWAVGTVLSANPVVTKSLIEHWNGHGWHIQPSISPGSGNFLLGATALTGARVWAAGAYTFGGNLGTLVEFWDGTSWAEQPTPDPDLDDGLLGIAARRPADAWAVGFRASLIHPRTLILHWNGTIWKVVPSPSPSTNQDVLQGVAVVSGSYAWAAGYQGHFTTLIERWNGTTWKVTPSPN